MRKSRFTEEQIRYAVEQAEVGISVPELCRKYGISGSRCCRHHLETDAGGR